MKLSAPIFRLKKAARALSRAEGIPLHLALDRIAQQEGFTKWSLLAARMPLTPTASQILDQFERGDLVLLGGRPQQGKTQLGLSLIANALRKGDRAAFFTLYHTQNEVRESLSRYGVACDAIGERLLIDTSDEINAPHIVSQLAGCTPGTLVVIDYLQILDQRRDTPDLNAQIQMLKHFAIDTGAIVVTLSQVSRAFDPAAKSVPDLSDVHMPNPIDLSLFSQTCFLSEGSILLEKAA